MVRQNFIGLVVSQGKMQKTVKVRVQTRDYDKKVHKEVLKRKDYLVHDEGSLCKEGDIVRIESIPKISSRKYFAIAEIKVDKGQQFELYQQLAKEKLVQEEQQLMEKVLGQRNQTEHVINKVEDLKVLDRLANKFQSNNSNEVDKEFLIEEINKIKQKYNINSWPTIEPVLDLQINEDSKDLSILDNRVNNIKNILDKLMSEEYSQSRNQILTAVSKQSIESLKPNIQRNMLRKFVLDPRNECPVML